MGRPTARRREAVKKKLPRINDAGHFDVSVLGEVLGPWSGTVARKKNSPVAVDAPLDAVLNVHILVFRRFGK